jgi:eukaryotic-like serine/threonine-protein kinase
MSPQKESAEAMVGTILEGAYRIEGLVAEGGMGAVYAATHLRLGKRVAVKVMSRELAANPEALSRFHREAVVTSALGHPNIVQVFDFSATPTGEPFLVMELLEGEDLEKRIRRTGGLTPARTLHILEQVSAALAASHAKGIVHRDLKPANIFLLEAAGTTDFVKVLDFGISKIRAGTTKLTRASAVMGTPNYMSPEQALGQVSEIDDRTDQWALACIAWECLTGDGPFGGDSSPAVLFQVVHEPPPRLVAKVSGLAPEVEQALRRALSKNKDDRFPSVADFTNALRDAITGAPSEISPRVPTTEIAAAARPLSPPTMPLADSRLDVTSRPERPASAVAVPGPTTFTRTSGELTDPLGYSGPARSKWIWVGVGGVAVTLLVGAVWLVRSSPSPKPAPVSPHGATTKPTPPAPPPPPPPAVAEDLPAPAPDCVPGQRRCLEGSAQQCGSSGQWEAPAPCAKSAPCRDGECAPLRPSAPSRRRSSTATVPPPEARTDPPAKRQAANCSPNFYLDAQGEKHFKPECFSNGAR